MKNNRIILGLLLLVVLVFGLTACNQSETPQVSTEVSDETTKETPEASVEENKAVENQVEDFEDSDWTLVWQDEFNGDTLDQSKWQYETGNWIVDVAGNGVAPGWGNNEKQFYTDKKENIYLEEGQLVLKAMPGEVTDDYGTYEYTSGKIISRDLFSQKYGRFEASMKLPVGQGLWPAFWMMPQDSVYGAWAASGEIDIMEAAGSKPSRVGGAIHYGGQWPENTYTSGEYHFEDTTINEGFHRYAIEWEPGEIRWYVDDELYMTKNEWYTEGDIEGVNYEYPAPFNKDFYMILNLAVGGWYDGDPKDDSIFPASVNVDYVRVYELTGRPYRELEMEAYEPEELPEDAKMPLENGNLVYNSGFDGDLSEAIEIEGLFENIYTQGLEGIENTDFWYYIQGFGGEGIYSIETLDSGEKAFVVDVISPGNQNYAIQLIQDVSLAKGHEYRLSFQGKAETKKSIHVKVGSDGNDSDHGWQSYAAESFRLSTDFETHSYTFKMRESTDLDSRLEFNLGQNVGRIWLKDIKLEKITE